MENFKCIPAQGYILEWTSCALQLEGKRRRWLEFSFDFFASAERIVVYMCAAYLPVRRRDWLFCSFSAAYTKHFMLVRINYLIFACRADKFVCGKKKGTIVCCRLYTRGLRKLCTHTHTHTFLQWSHWKCDIQIINVLQHCWPTHKLNIVRIFFPVESR